MNSISYYIALLIIVSFVSKSFSSFIIDRNSFIVKYYGKVWLDQGLLLFSNTDLTSDALTKFEISYDIYPSQQSAYHCMKCNIVLGRTYQAITWGKTALASVSNNYEFQENEVNINDNLSKSIAEDLLHLGISLYYQKDYDASMLTYNIILEHYPTHNDALFNMGVALDHTGDFVRAAEYFYKAILSDPYDFRSRLNLAAIHHQRGTIQDAISHYRYTQHGTSNDNNT